MKTNEDNTGEACRPVAGNSVKDFEDQTSLKALPHKRLVREPESNRYAPFQVSGGF